MSSQGADDRFRYAIARVFTLIGWDLDLPLLVKFLRRQFEEPDASHTFVSFNYDLALEGGIERARNGAIDLTRLYGFPISLQVTDDPPPSMDELGGGAFSGLPVIGFRRHE